MSLAKSEIRDFILSLGFEPENGKVDVYLKKYSHHDNYPIRIRFDTEKIEYCPKLTPQDGCINLGDTTTSNFSHSENFVVLECVNRLLEKGYAPKSITLEKKYPLGHGLKGKLDITVAHPEGDSYLMIECKTWGAEYEKELKKTAKTGGQLFSYYSNDRAVKYLCLYTSQLDRETIVYKNSIVPVDETWKELATSEDIHGRWNKHFKDNGIFETWATAYEVEPRALIRSSLMPLSKEDSGLIFNQFAEILRHNVVSDKPNAFNKILNLFICKIIDEDKNNTEQLDFQWLEDDTDESLQARLSDLYRQGMARFLDIEITDLSDTEIIEKLPKIDDDSLLRNIRDMLLKLRLMKNHDFAFMEVYDEQSFITNGRIVREIVELLQPYQFRYGHKQQFLGDFFELLLNTSMKQEAGQFFTPVPICHFIVSSLPIKEIISEKISNNGVDILPCAIDFACGTGHFLTEYMDRVQTIIEDYDMETAKPSVKDKLNTWRHYEKYGWAKDYVYGIDADYRLVKSAKVSLFLNGDGEANIIRANGLDSFTASTEYKGKLKKNVPSYPQDNCQFDILIANPPYSVSSFKSTIKKGSDSFSLFERFSESSSEIECLFVERMKQLLKPGGCAGIILPNTVLNGSGIYASTRRILLKYFKFVGVVELGSHTFMATTTNTIILFLKRRPNEDSEKIERAVDKFFDHPTDFTLLNIEHPFSLYVSNVYPDLSFEDYKTFVQGKACDSLKQQDIWQEYRIWFASLPEIVKLKAQRRFKEKSAMEQQEELSRRFYDKIRDAEKEKIVFFLLAYGQAITLVKTGEKKEEKRFLGYEFKNRRGKEGLHMLPGGTMLYDDSNPLNPEKASSYIYRSFLEDEIPVEPCLKDNVLKRNLVSMMDFRSFPFNNVVSLHANEQRFNAWNCPTIPVKEALVPVASHKKVKREAVSETGSYPVVSQSSSSTIEGYCDFDPVTDLPVVVFGDHNCSLKYIDFPFVQGSEGTHLLKCSESLDPKFFYYALKTVQPSIPNKGQYERHYKYLEDMLIPIPDREIQEAIAADLDRVASSLESLRVDVGQSKAKIAKYLDEIDSRNESRIPLGELANPHSEPIDPQKEEGRTIYLGLENIVSNEGMLTGNLEASYSEIQSTKFAFTPGDVLYGKLRPQLNKVYYATMGGICSTDIIVLRFKSSELARAYSCLMRHSSFTDAAAESKSGKQLPRTTWDKIKTISLPPLKNDDIETIASCLDELEARYSAYLIAAESIAAENERVFKKYLA